MPIGFSGGKVTIGGYYAGSFAASAGTSTTMTTTGMSNGAYIGRKVYIISGTGAGAEALVTANTTTVLTSSHGFWLPGSNGAIAERVTPDNTSVFAIGWNCADLIAAQPTYCSWLTGANLEMKCTVGISISAASAFGDADKLITLSTSTTSLNSSSGGYFSMGYVNLSGVGVGGGVLKMYLTSGTATIDNLMLGPTRFHGGEVYLQRTINKHMRWNVASSGDGIVFIDSKITGFGITLRTTDVIGRTFVYGEEFVIMATPAVFAGVKVYEGWSVNAPNSQLLTGNIGSSPGMAGGDVFDMQFLGELRPIAMYYSRANYDTPYFWRTNFGYYTSLSTVVDWYNGPLAGIVYLGTIASVTTHDSSDAALGGVKVGVLEGTSGDGRIVGSKDGTTHAPVLQKFVTTDGSGNYTGPWGSGEGIPVIYADLRYTSEYVSAVTSYHAGNYVLIFTKYGYLQQIQARGYTYKLGASETSALVADPYTVAAYATAIAYTGMAWTAATKTLVLSSTHTVQEIYDYMHAKMDYEAGTNDTDVRDPITSLNGVLTSLSGLWTITDDGYIDYTGRKLTGGTIEYTTAGTYAPILDTCTLQFSAASGSFDLSYATISGVVDLVNTGGGSIDVYLPTGVGYTNTGPNITVHAPIISQGLAFVGLTAGSQVVVFATGTQTELYRDNASGTTSTFSQTRVTDITVDYTVMLAGYLPIRVTGVLLTNSVLTTPISQLEDRTYAASSGLTYGTTATVNTGTKLFTLGATSTTQNWYSFWIEAWIAQAALTNTEFPLSVFGPYSVALRLGYEFNAPADIAYLSRGGIRYRDAGGATTAMWAGFLSAGIMTGLQAKYQQQDGSGTTATAGTGIVNQLVQIYGDATHGNFDYTGHMVFKCQEDGYDQSEADVGAVYGTLEDELYIFGLSPTVNGLAVGDPALASPPAITDHGATPVTWHAKAFSLTITDSATGNSGENIMRWLRYNFSLGGAFQGKDGFNWHDLTQVNGTKFKTVRGHIWGGAGAAVKGVRVVQNDGVSDHPDFNLFTADDGTTYAPPLYQQVAVTGMVAGSRLQIYDLTSATELYNGIPGGTSYTWIDPSPAAANRAIRVRIAYVSGATAKDFVEATPGTCGMTEATATVSYAASQVADDVYNTNAVDGSTVTGITIAGGTLEVDVAVAIITLAEIYAFNEFYLFSATGIADIGDFLEGPDTGNLVFHSGMKLKNTTSPSVPLKVSGGWVRAYGSTDPNDVLDTTGGTIFAMPPHVASTVVSVGGVNIITGDINDVAVQVQAGLNSQGYTTTRAPKLDNIDAALNQYLLDYLKTKGIVTGTDSVISPTGITAGSVMQTISESGGVVTVSRP